jgi:hypothetical protein
MDTFVADAVFQRPVLLNQRGAFQPVRNTGTAVNLFLNQLVPEWTGTCTQWDRINHRAARSGR